jgi:hypothetical protein
MNEKLNPAAIMQAQMEHHKASILKPFVGRHQNHGTDLPKAGDILGRDIREPRKPSGRVVAVVHLPVRRGFRPGGHSVPPSSQGNGDQRNCSAHLDQRSP